VPDMPTGQLIRLYRIDRKKSTVNVATLAGITGRYLEMIEAGTKTPSLPVLRSIAKVLGVRTSALLGEAPSEDHQGPVNPRLAEVERALYTYRSISLTSRGGDVPELSDISDRLRSAWESWLTSPNKYTDTLSVLPDLIVDAETAVSAYERSLESCRIAADAYMLARAVLKHAGRIDLVPLVCDRVMRYAEEVGDPLLIGAATWYVGQAILSNDMPQGALDIAVPTAERFERLLPDGTEEHFYVYGSLLQLAAIASVRIGDPWRARELLRDPARQAADRVGEGKGYYHIYFGPTNLNIHRVSVELEAGEVSEALSLSGDVELSNIGCLERRTSHLYEVARCYELRNEDLAVFVHLRMAAKMCPQDFLYTQEARNMVGTLVKRAGPSYASEVRAFADEIGLLN